MVGLVLILLSERLVEEAEIVAREFGSNCSGEQGEIIEDLLDAADQNDEQKMEAALAANCLLSLDWEYVTVIKNIGVDKSAQGVRPRTRRGAHSVATSLFSINDEGFLQYRLISTG